MVLTVSGIVVLIVTVVTFLGLRPKGDKLHRWADTAWEPYIAVAICGGVALAFTMTLSGVLQLLGS